MPRHCAGLIALLGGSLVFALDRATKTLVLINLKPIDFINSFCFNKGIAFGLFNKTGFFIASFGVLIMAGIFCYLIKRETQKSSIWVLLLISVILFSGISNLLDRFAYGRVLDFIKIPLWPYAFNVADAAVNISCFLLVLNLFIDSYRKCSHLNSKSRMES